MDIKNNHKELLDFIKETDNVGMSRLQAFSLFARKHNIKCETVRNQYYSLIKQYNLKDDFKISQSKNFSKSELKNVMTKLINLLNQGKSVRSACLEVSNGDAKLMLRLQNKFRAMLKNDIDYLEKLGYNKNLNKQICLNFNEKFKQNLNLKNDTILHKNSTIVVENNGILAKNDNEPKVLRMPKSNLLTDNDINNLFMGLVKMVKRNAIENAPQLLKNQCEEANLSLKEALVKLGVSTRKLEIIKCENYELKKKLNDSRKLLNQAQQEYFHLLNKITNIGKIDDLKKFVQEYRAKSKTKNIENIKTQ